MLLLDYNFKRILLKCDVKRTRFVQSDVCGVGTWGLCYLSGVCCPIKTGTPSPMYASGRWEPLGHRLVLQGTATLAVVGLTLSAM